MLRTLKNNKKGVVFVTVLMIIIVMMVLAISIISMNVSQVMVAESEVKRIQAEIIAFGAIAYTFANQASSSPGNDITYSTTIGTETFDTVINVGTPVNDISPLSINVIY